MWTSDPMLSGLRVLVLLSASGLTFVLARGVAAVPSVEPLRLGLGGRQRARAREASAMFAAFEPVLAKLAGLSRLVPWSGLRSQAQRLLERAGDAAGLCADELIALSLTGFVLGLGASTWLVASFSLDSIYQVLFALAGLTLPSMRLDGVARERAKDLERSLPSAMDLCVLCMGAGTDFPSALGFAVRELGLGHEVCREELSVLLEQLKLGRTRVQALQALGERTGSHTVQQFVAAVCQSETKGTPLVQALSIQASTLRQRRSVLAEEMAAKASVRLILPLMLMVSSLLLIIFAPFIINGVGL